jgi:hypothetical protein
MKICRTCKKQYDFMYNGEKLKTKSFLHKMVKKEEKILKNIFLEEKMNQLNS